MGLKRKRKRTGTAEKDGTAQTSGASKQGKRQRHAEPPPTAPATPVWPDPGNGVDPLIGHFATIVGGLEHEDADGDKHSLDGLYGVVEGIQFSDEDGQPVSATFGIRTRPAPGVYRPATGDGNIVVPWKNLRRSVSGQR